MRNLAFVVCFVVLLLSCNLNAQSISITSLSGTEFCTGDSVDVTYTATGNYTNRNSFTVQLSDQAGGFDKFFYNLGSKRTTTSGVIRIGVPQLDPSNQYRVRVISSEPYAVSPIHSAVLSLGPKPSAGATAGVLRYSRFVAVMVDDTVRFQNQSQNATTFYWEFGPEAIPATSTERDPLVRFTSPGVKRASMIATSPNGCSSTWATDDGKSHDRPTIVVVTCFPTIPASAMVDSTAALEYHAATRDIWIVPGGVMGGHDDGMNYYVEPGGTINTNGRHNIVYLKAGAAYFGSHHSDVSIVYEEGAGMQGVWHEQLLKCSNLEFDYSDAPPYKINPASVSRIKGSTVQVYPNPTTDRLTIEHAENHIREISIRNTLGAEQLFMQPEGLGKTTVDISRLAAGLYFLDLLTDQGIQTHKIVVSR